MLAPYPVMSLLDGVGLDATGAVLQVDGAETQLECVERSGGCGEFWQNASNH